MLPSIEPSEVGATGLLWLFLSYGYILYKASNMIAEGSDLLLLVPSVAGIVGSIILPILGAVPDGAIMLFSGLGDKEQAQETLSVGVGALAGSTIMLLTIPFSLSLFAGRVDLDDKKVPLYTKKPKLYQQGGINHLLFRTGVAISQEVKFGALIMVCTTIPYFLIQVPASFLHGPLEEVAAGEKAWALAGFIVCLVGFVSYLFIQVRIANKGEDRLKRLAVMKKLINAGKVSMSGAMADAVKCAQMMKKTATTDGGYHPLADGSDKGPSATVRSFMDDFLREAFNFYDMTKNNSLDRNEVRVFCRDFHEDISGKEIDNLFDLYDGDGDSSICYNIIVTNIEGKAPETSKSKPIVRSFLLTDDEDTEEEEEDLPEDISKLSPEQQQRAIIKQALTMLTLGTALVLLFSDPMVDVLQEMATRINISPFYVSFVLAPLAANASEVIALRYYATKKTRKTITVSLTALEGAACMNNTFCLSIFMGLIYVRGLAWQYTAETIAIVVVQLIMGIAVQRKSMTAFDGILVLSLFPLSLVLVGVLEAFGFD